MNEINFYFLSSSIFILKIFATLNKNCFYQSFVFILSKIIFITKIPDTITQNIDTFSHYSSQVASHLFTFFPHSIQTKRDKVGKKNFKIVPRWERSTQQANKINQRHSQSGKKGRMKLKALHHSILVKAEFFMKQEGNMFVEELCP